MRGINKVLNNIKAEIKEIENEADEEVRYGSENTEYYRGKAMGLAIAIAIINKYLGKENEK